MPENEIKKSRHGNYKNEKWYFGAITRERAQEILKNESEVGTFLIRASSSVGDYALSVRENMKVNHYKIDCIISETLNDHKYRLGSIEFISIPALIKFYEKNNLYDSVLSQPAKKPIYYCMYDFRPTEESTEDIALQKEDKVTFLGLMPNDPDWWEVIRISDGQSGYAPKEYLVEWDVNADAEQQVPRDTVDACVELKIPLPATAIAIRPRRPNLFDSCNHLRLSLNDEVKIRKQDEATGLWLAVNITSQKKGLLHLSYVRLVSDDQRISIISNATVHSRSSQPQATTHTDISEML